MINYVGENGGEKVCISDEFLDWSVNYHASLIDFKKRPITTFLVEKTCHLLKVRSSVAFVIVDFGFFFLCGFLIYYLARLYSISHSYSLISAALFLSSFSILLAFFIPIATYDEPVQYFLILLSLISIERERGVLFVIFFSLATLARESSVILLPAILLFYMGVNWSKFGQQKMKILKTLIVCALPVVFYSIYLFWFYSSEPQLLIEAKEALNERADYFERNFRNMSYTLRTLISFISIYLLPAILVLVYLLKNKKDGIWNISMKAFGFTVLINTLVVFVSVYAEEARVFALPLLLIFPVLGHIWGSQFNWSKPFFKFLLDPRRILTLIVWTAVGWYILQFLYSLTDINIADSLFLEYNVLTIFVIGVLVLSLYHDHISRSEEGSILP